MCYAIIFQTIGYEEVPNKSFDKDDQSLFKTSTNKEALTVVKTFSRWLQNEENSVHVSLHELQKFFKKTRCST